MTSKQKNVSALNKEQVAYIKGCSLLQTAVWRITHREPVKALGNTLANTLFKNSILLLISARQKNTQMTLKFTLQKWQKISRLINGIRLQRRVLLKLIVTNYDTKYKTFLSKYLLKWKNLSTFSAKDFLKKYGALFKLLDLVKKKALKPTKQIFFSRLKRYVNRTNKPQIRGLVNLYGRSKKEILRQAFFIWKNNVKKDLMNFIKRKFLQLAIKSSLKRSGREMLLKAIRKWNKNAQKEKLLKNNYGYLLLTVYSKWTKFNKTTAILTALSRWRAFAAKKDDRMERFLSAKEHMLRFTYLKNLHRLLHFMKKLQFYDLRSNVLSKLILKTKKFKNFFLRQKLRKWNENAKAIANKELLKKIRLSTISVLAEMKNKK